MRLALTLTWMVGLAGQALAQQDPTWQDVRFYRVYLRNGNFIDGDLIKQTPQEVLLRLRSGEISIRSDQIDRLEFIKMRDLREAPVPLTSPKPVFGHTGVPGRNPPAGAPTSAQSIPVFKADEQTRLKLDPLLAELSHANPEAKLGLMDRLAEVGGDTGPYLASILEKVDRSDISVVTAAIVKSKDPRAIPILAKQLNNPDAVVRTAAASALGGLADESIVEYLLPALSDKDPTVKTTVIGSIALAKNRRALEAIMGVTSDPDRQVRALAIQSASDLASKLELKSNYADGLVRALDQASPNAKFDLIGALGRTQLRDKWNVIAPYLRDDLPELRAAAAAALGDLGAAEASEALVSQAAAETDGRVKIRIAGAAKTLFVKGAIDPLLRWLRDDSEVVRTESSAALETLTGQKFGLDTAKWDAWWADNRPK